MSALFIAGWAQTDCPNGVEHHVIGVFLMGLDVGPEFRPNMLVLVEMFAGQEVMGGQGLRHPIRWWDSVQPKNSIPDEPNEHDTWNLFKRK